MPHGAKSKGRAIRNASLSYAAALALLAVLLAGGPAHAEDRCAAIEGGTPGLAALDASARLRFIDGALRHGARRTRQWAWSWAGIYSALTTYNLARLADADADSRIDDLVGASASFIGLMALVVNPQKVMGDQRRLERRLRAGPPANACAELAFAEKLLLRSAASQRFGVGTLTHIGNFAINAGLSLLLGLGFHHWSQAAITGFVGIAVGELQIASQPTDVAAALTRYRKGDLSLPRGWLRGFAFAPMIGSNRVGFALSLSF